MPYILKKYYVKESIKVENFLLEEVKLSEPLSLKLLKKGRILDHKNKRLQKGAILKDGFIEVCIFEAITKNLKAIFETEHFAIFDKPSGLKVHPVLRSSEYTLLDEIRYYFGSQAQLVHRIDAQTSGLVLVSKNPYSHMLLSLLFEERKCIKKYHALVHNEVKKEILINEKIENSHGLIKIKMQVGIQGKESCTLIKPILFNQNTNQTLVEAHPYTGRQHQIRVHLDYLNHSIVGDRIYGLDEKVVDDILSFKLSEEEITNITKAKRLMLHAFYLEFTFLHKVYKFCSKQDIFNL